MIKATRMKLINWHNFTDNIIDFRNSTFFVGLNAVGKTTIIDAFRYCLTTSKDFNAAGSKRSDRTLQGCIHQKQRSGDYDRPGHVVAYVAIEFLDSSIEKRFVIIVRVESLSPDQELKNVSQDWYISKAGYSLDDIHFMLENGGKRIPMSRDEFKTANKSAVDHPATQTEAKRRILRVTGIGDDTSKNGKKFYEVFNKGTNLRDIDQIQSFIKEYILREPDIDITKLYTDLETLEKFQTTLAESERRADALREIIGAYDAIAKTDREYHIIDLMLQKARLENAVFNENENLKDISATELQLKRLNNQIKNKQDEVYSASSALEEAREKCNRNEDYNSIDELQKDLNRLKNEEDRLREEAARFDEVSEELNGLISDLSTCGFVDSANTAVPSADSDHFDLELSTLQSNLATVSKTLISKYGAVENRVRENNTKRNILSAEIKELESGRMVYPPSGLAVKDAINQAFNEHGYAASAKFLCEFLEMAKPEWQETVESYLNKQRFYIVVPEKLYRLAKEVFISLGDSVGSTGLLDTPSILLHERKVTNDASLTLADTVRVENPAVAAYIRFRLGDVICCDKSADLEKYQKSVTPERLRYQGFSLQRMNKVQLYIGQEAIARRLDAAKSEISTLVTENAALQSEFKHIAELNERFTKFVAGTGYTDLATFATSRGDAEKKFAERIALKSKIDKIKKSAVLQGLLDRVEVCEKAFKEANEELIDLLAQEKSTGNSLDKLELENGILGADREKMEHSFDEACKQYPAIIGDMESMFSDVIKRYKTPALMLKNYERASMLQKKESERDSMINNTLKPLQSMFAASYSTDYLPGMEGERQYRDAYAGLVKIELEKHKKNLEEARKKCKERFQSDVLYRLKDDIEEAKRDIKSLNRVMESLRYGEESYRFYIDASSNTELNAYYNLIMREDNRENSEQLGFDSFGSNAEEFAAQTESLMNRIFEEVEMNSRQAVNGERVTGLSAVSYADYRTYLDYDIIVKNQVTEKESRLSKVGGSGSGGENQAPFYVAICASLLNIYRQSDNSIRLILLDEAFNKMTGDRIKTMMKMFADLDMQLILTSTEEKTATIRPFCDLTYSIVKKGSYVNVEDFAKVEEKYAELRERDRQ